MDVRAIMKLRAICGDEGLASLTYARPRMSVSLYLDHSSLDLGEGTLWIPG